MRGSRATRHQGNAGRARKRPSICIRSLSGDRASVRVCILPHYRYRFLSMKSTHTPSGKSEERVLHMQHHSSRYIGTAKPSLTVRSAFCILVYTRYGTKLYPGQDGLLGKGRRVPWFQRARKLPPKRGICCAFAVRGFALRAALPSQILNHPDSKTGVAIWKASYSVYARPNPDKKQRCFNVPCLFWGRRLRVSA